MKFILEWKPVIHMLDLGEYNELFAGQSIPVCVNPPQGVMDERARLQNEFSARFEKYSKALTERDDAVIAEFTAWTNETFVPGVNDWYARLFSHNGGEAYTAADIAEYARIDLHFYNWILHRAIEMIGEHRTGRKKNSAKP